MQAVLTAIEGIWLVEDLRASRWVYPLVNIGHLIGLAGLFGAVLVLDFRLLGLWRATDISVIEPPLVRVAAAGLALALMTGLLLFAVRANEYAAMPVFWTKIALVALGTGNAVLARFTGSDTTRPKLTAATSLLAWLGAISAGRLIGYMGT